MLFNVAIDFYMKHAGFPNIHRMRRISLQNKNSLTDRFLLHLNMGI